MHSVAVDDFPLCRVKHERRLGQFGVYFSAREIKCCWLMGWLRKLRSLQHRFHNSTKTRHFQRCLWVILVYCHSVVPHHHQIIFSESKLNNIKKLSRRKHFMNPKSYLIMTLRESRKHETNFWLFGVALLCGWRVNGSRTHLPSLLVSTLLFYLLFATSSAFIFLIPPPAPPSEPTAITCFKFHGFVA